MSSCIRAVRSCIRACLRGRRDADQGFHMLDDQTEAPAPVDDQQEGVRNAEPTEPLVSSRPASAAQVPPPPAAAYLAVMRHSVRFYVELGVRESGGVTRYKSHAAPKRRSASIATMMRSGPSRRRGLTTRPSRTGISRRRSARRCDGSASIVSSPRLSGGASRRRAWSPRRSV